MSRKAFLFPGQGAQVVGMGKDFYESFSKAREVFQFGDEILKRSLTKVIFNGPEEELIETRNSQPAIFLTSLAILAVLKEQFPTLKPHICAGLSLGEYTALTASGKIPFEKCLLLVQLRADAMNEACERTKGTMAAISGLSKETVEKMVKELNLPEDLWVANFNCPGQTVISGTIKGIDAGIEEAKKRGAKRALPLKVHGAFHSGLMRYAKEKLAREINQLSFLESPIQIVMNVTGNFVKEKEEMRRSMIEQVTASVRWEESVRAMMPHVDSFIEIGCGKVLASLNKQIGVASTITINKVEDLENLAKI